MNYTAAVITVSDKGYRGEREDTSGPEICRMLQEAGFEVRHRSIVPDERHMIQSELIKCSDEMGISLVVTTGGTGFSPRDVTPEATLAVIERETRGIPEAMRAESMKITNRGCLSRAAAGIRGRTLIINLPGSKKAAKENLEAALDPVHHGLDMLYSEGSADCAKTEDTKKPSPSMDEWLRQAKLHDSASKVGMYLCHNGVVRESARAKVREGAADTSPVTALKFSYDEEKVASAIDEAYKLPGVYYVRVWLNEGTLQVGDDIMYVLIGGDIRPNVIDGLQFLVGKIKSECVSESELY